MLIKTFRIKMKLITHYVDLNNLINYIINIIIVKHRFFTIDKMIIKRIKGCINCIKINILIEISIRLLLYKRNLKINYKSSLFKINH